MKNISFYIFAALFVIFGTAEGASLLQPKSFPKTADDLTFIQSVALKQEGYEPWETIYDDKGRCISGCLYPGITIQEDLALAEERTAMAWNLAQQYIQTDYQQYTSYQPQPQVDKTVPQNSDLQNIVTAVQQPQRGCAPANVNIPINQRTPFGLPLLGKPIVTSGFGGRIHPVTGEQSGHWGIDLAATVGTNVFSPANGTVAAVWTDSTCGNGLRIQHSDGYETVYCHLNKVFVKNGETVKAGCKVAETGNTGRTTGPHLHYGIKQQGGFINPTKWISVNS